MSYFRIILIKRDLGNCPTPLWKLKVTDEEYLGLQEFLEAKYNLTGNFEGYPKEAALYLAEWWKRNSWEPNDSPFASLGFPKNDTGDALLLESAKRVFDPSDEAAYIPGLKLVKSDRGREFEYSLYYQGGFPMGRACSKKGALWSSLIKKFVKKNIDFDTIQGAKIAKRTLREYKDYLVSAAREQKPDGMPFVCDETHPWYRKAVESIQAGDKERCSRPFHIKWCISKRVADFVLKCQILGPSRLDSNFLLQFPALKDSESIPVQLFINDEYQDTLIEYHRTSNDNFFSYYELNRTILYDGDSKVSLRIPGIDQPIVVSDVDMSIPHAFYLTSTSNNEYLMGAQKFGERKSIIVYNNQWELKKTKGPHTIICTTFNGEDFSFLTCGIPDDDSEIEFIIGKKNSSEEYKFGSDITPTWTEVSILKPYNTLVVEDLYDFSDDKQVCVMEMKDEEEERNRVPTSKIHFRQTANDRWSTAKLYGKVQCAVIDRNKNTYATPEKNILSVGPNFEVGIIHFDIKGEETHYLIQWDQGDIYAKDGKLKPTDDGIWIFKKEEYESTVEFTCYPYKGTPFNINIRAIYRDFGIFSPTGEKVKQLGIIPWTELSSYSYRVKGLRQLNINPYGETSIVKYIKTKKDEIKGLPEEGSMSLLLEPEVLKKYEWRADIGFDFGIRYTNFTLMKNPLNLTYNAGNRTIEISIPINSSYDSDEVIKENRESIKNSFKGHLLVINEKGSIIADIARNDDGAYMLPSIPDYSLIISNQRGYVKPMMYVCEELKPLSVVSEDNSVFVDSKLDDICWDAANAFLRIGLEHGIQLNELPKIGCIIKNPGLILALYCRNVITAGTDPEKLSNVKSSMNRLLKLSNFLISDLNMDIFEDICKDECFIAQFEEWQRIYGNNNRKDFLYSIAGKVQYLIMEQ